MLNLNEPHGDEHLDWCNCGYDNCKCDRMMEFVTYMENDFLIDEGYHE